jgi:dTDP-L-rhamnose 4-epimerase
LKVLITGGAGFIGSHTADLLLRRGYEVRVIDSLEPPVHRHRDKPGYLSDEVEFIMGNIGDRDAMEKALQGVDAVLHLAAYQDYLTDFSKFAVVNDAGTALLYELIVNRKLPVRKVILGSSQAVYGEGKYQCSEHGTVYPPPRPLAQLERGEWEVRCPSCGRNMKPLLIDEAKVNPHNQYAVSKYSQELYALTLGRRFDIPTVVLRYSITQGPRQSFYNAYSGILRIFTICLLNDMPPIIYEDGRQLRDYVHVGDVAEANVVALENDAADFEVFNVGSGQATTVLEYAARLNALLGKDIKPRIPGEFRLGDSRHAVSDISKLRGLGWRPKLSLEDIINEYLHWAQDRVVASGLHTEAHRVMKQLGVVRSRR